MAETAVLEDPQAQDDFAAGFGTDAPPPKATPTPEPAKKETPAAKGEVKAEPVVDVPKFAKMTQQEFDDLKAAAGKTASFEQQLSKAFGSIGHLKQVIEKLQAGTPSGEGITVTADDFAELEAEFPELSASHRKGLERVLQKLRGTGATQPDPEATRKLVDEAAKAQALEALEDAYPDWRETVGPFGSDNPFRKWLAGQTPEYQKKLNETNNALIISRALDQFQASLTPKAETSPETTPKAAARKDRIQGAIQPRGDGGAPPPAKTADDEFAEGFRTG